MEPDAIGTVLGLAFVAVVAWLVMLGVVTWTQNQDGPKKPTAVLLIIWVVLSMLGCAP